MSEAGDYVPAPHWQGVNDDFKSARRAYDDAARRSYDDKVAKVAKVDIKAGDHVPEFLETNCESPLVILCDGTGSMGDWPATIFSKLPYLEYEGQEYLGDDMEISFAVVGDGYSDKYPLQVRPFAKGVDMKAQLEKLILEGNGGGTGEESYELGALYYANNCRMPEAIRKPICIFIGDEGIYSTVSETQAATWARVDEKKLTPAAVFKKLTEKFNVYVIRKPYGSSGNNPSSAETKIQNQWIGFLGEENVVSLPVADRVVDVIFGILAKETGRIDYFEKELKDRQGKDADGDKKIAMVMKSLVTMHKIDKDPSLKKLNGPKGAKSKSITPGKSKSKAAGKSISLLDD